MKRPRRLRLSILTSLLALGLMAPLPAPADSLGLVQRRAASCGGPAFDKFGEGEPTAYLHRRFKVRGETVIGDAVLEWCQTAQNAVIYFYVDDPEGPDHGRCPQNMSFAVFPGAGGEVREIIDDNVPSYFNPQVKLIEAPKTSDTRISAGGRTIEAYQLAAVVEQNGMHIRRRMIGYARGADFIRVMTGYRDDAGCRHPTVDRFLERLTWP